MSATSHLYEVNMESFRVASGEDRGVLVPMIRADTEYITFYSYRIKRDKRMNRLAIIIG